MLSEREELFTDTVRSSFENVKVVVAAEHKMLLFLALDSLKESLEALLCSEGAHQLFRRADAECKCGLVPCVDYALNIPPKLMGVPIVQVREVLQRCGEEVFPGNANQSL